MLRLVPEGQYIYNRRFQSAGYASKFLPLSRSDNTLRIQCCHYVTRAVCKLFDPPIEIGGYKYAVPLGR
jgi:hypothetical protein